MTGKELWEAFIRNNNLSDCGYGAFAFGIEADLLAHLVVIGEKTATASAYPLYKLENEPLPKVGAYSVVEGDKSLDYWREVHEKFFAECLNEVGLKFTSDMKVVCEEFSVVFKE